MRQGSGSSRKSRLDALGYSEMAAKRRALLSQRLETRKSIGVDRLRGQGGFGRLEELEQKGRTAEEQLASTSAFLKAIREAPSGLEEKGPGGYLSLEQAVGWSTMGRQEEGHRAMTAALPSKKAWHDEWTKTGAEGGMSATVLGSWSEWRAQTRDLEKQSMLRVSLSRKDALVLSEYPLRSFGRCSSMPRGTCRLRAKGSDSRRRRSSQQARALCRTATSRVPMGPWMLRFCAFNRCRCRSHRGACRKWRDIPRSFLRKVCRSGGAVLKQSVKRASGRSRLWRRTC